MKHGVILFSLVLVIFTAPASAQDRLALCSFLPQTKYVTSPDYVPGVDVHGNPVVPADVNIQQPSVADVIKIPVTMKLAESLMQPVPDGMELDAVTSMLEIYKDGRVKLNDRDLTSSAYAYCGMQAPLPEQAVKDMVLSEPVVAQEEPEKITVPESMTEAIEEQIIWGEGY